MQITNVSYRKNFSISQFIFEHIGLDAQLEPHENPAEVLAQLKKQVEELHRQNNPQLWENQPLPKYGNVDPSLYSVKGDTITFKEPFTEESTPRLEKQTLAEAIKTCTSLKVLETYKLLIQKDEQAKAAYLEMLEKLSPKQNA